MSKIQERLNLLRPYVIGIRYLEGIQLVDAVLKEGWTVPESQLIQKQKVDGEENYICSIVIMKILISMIYLIMYKKSSI
jgi:hypothetical protein